MELIIEHVGRGSRHFEFQKVSGEQVTIGRSFDNDVVLADPHVCAHHAVLETNETGEIVIRDLGSVNGTRTKKHKLIGDKYAISSGDELIFGKTHLRIFRRDHPVAPSIRLNKIEKLVNIADNPWVTAVVLTFVLLLNMYLGFSAQLESFHIGRMLVGALGAIFAIAVWPVCWSIYARIKKHDLRFMAQFTITLIFITLIEMVQEIHDWLTFHTGTGTGHEVFFAGVAILLVLLLVWTNYYISGFQSSKKRWIYSGGLTTLLVSLVYIVFTMESDRFAYNPKYHSLLYPPSLSVYTGQSVEAYLEDAEKVFEKVTVQIND